MSRDNRWVELTWEELVDRLHVLLKEQPFPLDPGQDDAVQLAHELQVHQVELEMQNRQLREARGALEASRARYGDLFHNAPVGYATLDVRGNIVEINLAASAMLQAPREILVGVPFGAAAKLRERSAFQALLRSSARDPRPQSADLEFKPGGTPAIMDVVVKADLGPLGQRMGFLLTMIDVTLRRRAEEERAALAGERYARAEADAANHMKDQFLGIVSHELRTPLNAIVGWSQVLTERQNEPGVVGRGIDSIHRNARVLSRIVDDILDVSRIVSGKLQIEKKPIDLADVVQGALEGVRRAAEDKRIALRERVGRGCVVQGDAMRLGQVISNLLSNAIKFTAEGGTIEASLTASGDGALVAVQDDGCGIDVADLPHIFESFRQADASSVRSNPGLGLGLAIARHLVEAHGGTIDASSEGRGHGSLFTVHLPLLHAPAVSAPESGAARSIAGVKVLYVDDAADALETLHLQLQPLGAEVRTATSVDEAMTIVDAFAPQVIVTDVAMPQRDGYELLRAVRQLAPPQASTPVIALTAYARAEDASHAVEAGFAGHLGKPVDPMKLASMISSVVRRPSGAA